MKAIILLYVLACMWINTAAQEIEKEIDSFILLNQIDSFFVYSSTCSSHVNSADSCDHGNPKYLTWKKSGHYLLQKFERCNKYQPLLLADKNPLNFYFYNKEIIDTEEIKPPVYYEYKREKGRRYSIEVTSTISHSCFFHFSFHTTTSIKTKSIDSYNLEFTEFQDGKKSINTNYNNSTKLKQLILQMQVLINLTSFTKIN